MASHELSALLQEQRRYYAERAPEYDDWWLRRGQYATGPAEDERFAADAAEAEARIDALARVAERSAVREPALV